jgi:histidine triad (HIT) family protein
VYKDSLVSVFINSFWVPTCEGHVIVVPNEHVETIYQIPDATNHRIADIVRLMALALKRAYSCDGITTRQNNGPAADQHAFHYHHHVFPRYSEDTFNESLAKKSVFADPKARLPYAQKLKHAIHL